MRFTLITYGILAGVTPALVFANSLLMSVPPTVVQPLQAIPLANTLVDLDPRMFMRVDDLITLAEEMSSKASIIEEDGQLFLEFYHSIHATAQTPSLVLYLDANTEPSHDFLQTSDHTLPIGYLGKVAGKYRYPLPKLLDTQQYSSVVFWCPEFQTIMGYLPVIREG